MKIIFNELTKAYLSELIDILYYNHYFSIEENAREYVRSLVREVETTHPLRRKRESPKYFYRYGNNLWYATYRKNKRTTWYFFFTHHETNIYIIRYITNNHVAGHLLE
ncbi:MAG: hypothetical protein LUG51_07170 [Tannerellaceae bacterium]|nr:hypothetical protein [Tannerellaceae bacterium]